MIKILIVQWPGAKDPRFFFCTELELSVPEILERIAGRWSIETAIGDMKEHLGLNDYQCRKAESIHRQVNLTCWALSLLTLWSHQQARQKQPELWDYVPWYTHKCYISVQDMISQLKTKSFQTSIFRILASEGINLKNSRRLKRLFAPPDGRIQKHAA